MMQSPAVATIPEAISVMQELSSSLPTTDGVACFNSMYLQVTEAVGAKLSEGAFVDPEFMDRLDVNFVNLYLRSYAAHGSQGQVCRSWRTLFDRRDDDRVLPLQFALAGMNAHINHDLPLAVTMTSQELGRPPSARGVREDFLAVNAVLAEADDAVRARLQGPVAARLDELAGPVDDVMASWGIAQARDVAWGQALRLWELREEQHRSARFLGALDSVVSLASHCLLAPIDVRGSRAADFLSTAFGAVDDFGAGMLDALWGSDRDDDQPGPSLWDDDDDDGGDGVVDRVFARLRDLRRSDAGPVLAPTS